MASYGNITRNFSYETTGHFWLRRQIDRTCGLHHNDLPLRNFGGSQNFMTPRSAIHSFNSTRPATRAHVGRSERRLARSRAHEIEQRDVEVRFSDSVRPCMSPVFPSWDLGLPSFLISRPRSPLEYLGRSRGYLGRVVYLGQRDRSSPYAPMCVP